MEDEFPRSPFADSEAPQQQVARARLPESEEPAKVRWHAGSVLAQRLNAVTDGSKTRIDQARQEADHRRQVGL